MIYCTNCFSALVPVWIYLRYALLPHCTFCHRCSLWLPCGSTSFGGCLLDDYKWYHSI